MKLYLVNTVALDVVLLNVKFSGDNYVDIKGYQLTYYSHKIKHAMKKFLDK